MFFILHGDNEFEISERVADFKQKIGDESMRDLNITVLDGRKTTLGEVQHAADAIPFLADKRLVIVEGLLTRLASRKAKDGDGAVPSGAAKDVLNSLIDYVPRLPDTTRLVFVEFQPLNPKHLLIKLAEQQMGKTVIECKQPAATELPRWIGDRAKKCGGSIEPAAAQRLAALIGSDLRRLDTELNKLITYVNAQRSITTKDVDLLVSDASTSSVFDLVDALGKRDGQRAAHELHHLLDQGENPLGLLAMIVRQYRLLILVKELQGRSVTPDAMAKELGQHPFVIKKLNEQARNYRDIAQLEAIYRCLLDIEVEIKTGQTSDVLALDLLVAGVAG
ncbi:MAG: DNA polymerase III subunit delta [Chloroflexi bacterium]|nr:DNA polymerase III subunit delta [Chloroflexota bacterium]